MQRKKLPQESQYKRQVRTFIKRHGRAAYRQAGSLGGSKSPTRFDSERARAAAAKSWESRRAKAEAQRKENENVGQSKEL